MHTTFANADDILNFTLTIDPDEGMYRGGRFHFSFAINQNFPHDPPKVKCTQKIYHPNIDLDGNVCLNILREDWKPVLNLNAVIVGLQVSGTDMCLRGEREVWREGGRIAGYEASGTMLSDGGSFSSSSRMRRIR